MDKYHSENVCSCHHFHLARNVSYSTIAFCSIIQWASNALEVLKDVLDAVDAQHPQVSQGSVILTTETRILNSKNITLLYLDPYWIYLCIDMFLDASPVKVIRLLLVTNFFNKKINMETS